MQTLFKHFQLRIISNFDRCIDTYNVINKRYYQVFRLMQNQLIFLTNQIVPCAVSLINRTKALIFGSKYCLTGFFNMYINFYQSFLFLWTSSKQSIIFHVKLK